MSLSLSNLVVSRAGRALFAPLTVTLHAGGALLLLGANGSGKTTLLRTLAGLIPLREGALRGPDSVSYLGHAHGIHAALTVGEQFSFWENLAGSKTDANILARVGLDALRGRLCGTLSAGQKRRLALARLLVENSTLWLLDEPHSALDKEGTALLLDLIATHRAHGGMVVIATHGGLDVPRSETLKLGAA